MNSPFIWCDLSSYHPTKAMAFYATVLGWQFDAPEDGYHNAFIDDAAVAGLYEMPAKFRDIGLPSFWMSYIAVDSVATVVEVAKAQGGRIELEERDGAKGHVALIRDPLGAGFTVYEGVLDSGVMGIESAGLRAGHALYISDESAVMPFYNALFGWQVEQRSDYREIVSATNAPIAAIHECGEEERGGFDYWGIGFTVASISDTRRKITDAGGSIFSETFFGRHPALSVADRDEAAFFLIERAE